MDNSCVACQIRHSAVNVVPRAGWQIPEITLFDIAPGISLALRVDSAGLIFALLASLLWIFTSFYSIGYVRGYRNTTRQDILLVLRCVSPPQSVLRFCKSPYILDIL